MSIDFELKVQAGTEALLSVILVAKAGEPPIRQPRPIETSDYYIPFEP